jgi:2-keto-4-pentenoate hydratase/2-oxohepta-3-ene-1,7-dioic acid hydratase in catechol pathway
MRLATFTYAGTTRIGVVVGDEVVDLADADPGLPRSMEAFLAAGPRARGAAERAAAHPAARIPLEEVRLEAPVLRPRKILAVGLNYADHIAESGLAPPEYPTFFNKQVTAVTGPYDPIHLPRASRALDYEGELAFVIGRRCRHVPRERAAEAIAGYMVLDDVTVRDWQLRTPTWTIGKSFDTHCPMGPWIVSYDELGDPHSLGIRTFVNGELRQDANTSQMHYKTAELVAWWSNTTLEPGDIITSGSPPGVAAGMPEPKWLKAGDVIEANVAELGTLVTHIVGTA